MFYYIFDTFIEQSEDNINIPWKIVDNANSLDNSIKKILDIEFTKIFQTGKGSMDY